MRRLVLVGMASMLTGIWAQAHKGHHEPEPSIDEQKIEEIVRSVAKAWGEGDGKVFAHVSSRVALFTFFKAKKSKQGGHIHGVGKLPSSSLSNMLAFAYGPHTSHAAGKPSSILRA